MAAIYGELRILLVSFLFGSCLTLCYDLMRLGRVLIKRGWLLTGIEDVLFWLVAALLFAVMCLRENDGNVRWYMVAAACVGSYLCLFLEKLVKNSYNKLLQNGCNGGENRLQCKLESNRTDVMSSEKEEKKEI